MGRTYRTTSGWKWVFQEGGGMVAEPWSKTVELEEDPERAELKRIKERLDELCREVRETQYHYYTVLHPDDVDSNIRKAAEAALGICRRRLNIPWPVEIIWIEEENEGEKQYAYDCGFRDWDYIRMDSEIWGKTQNYSDKIWILKGLPFWDTVWTVGHELCHIAQSMIQPTEEREREANAFGYQIVNKIEAALR